MKIPIGRVYYPVTSLGPGQRVGIWVAGCNKACPGCISPDLQDSSHGREMDVNDLAKLFQSLKEKPSGYTISGGEPFLYPEALNELLTMINRETDDIIVFTGYTYEELIEMNSSSVIQSLQKIAVLIDGPFQKDNSGPDGLRGSRNQRIIILKEHKKYLELETQPRSLQTVICGNKVIVFGIP